MSLTRLTCFVNQRFSTVNSSFSTANVVGLVAQYSFVGIVIAQVLYFEQIRRDSILATGVRLLPVI